MSHSQRVISDLFRSTDPAEVGVEEGAGQWRARREQRPAGRDTNATSSVEKSSLRRRKS